MSRRFLITIVTILIIGIGGALAIFFAKGYRFNFQDGAISGTGIMSITSIPDQASVYLDDHLTTATDANVNSLLPKTYNVKIVKDGFIPWEKKVEIKQGLVSEVKATLFRSIPSVYPITYTGAVNATLSDDGGTMVYVVPEDPAAPVSSNLRKRSGVWVWQIGSRPLNFARGGEPRQIAVSELGVDYTQASFRFSPDVNQVMAIFPDRYLLLDLNRLNDPPRDITALAEITIRSWDDDDKAKQQTRMAVIKDLTLRKTASDAATLKWAPDETKLLYSADGKKDFKVVDIETKETFNIPQANYYSWHPDSEHIVLIESAPTPEQSAAQPKTDAERVVQKIAPGKISIVEFDGSNKSEIFAGNLDPEAVFVSPDGSRLMIISYLPIATASKPNLYGVNLK
jgi:hypothetical protein